MNVQVLFPQILGALIPSLPFVFGFAAVFGLAFKGLSQNKPVFFLLLAAPIAMFMLIINIVNDEHSVLMTLALVPLPLTFMVSLMFFQIYIAGDETYSEDEREKAKSNAKGLAVVSVFAFFLTPIIGPLVAAAIVNALGGYH